MGTGNNYMKKKSHYLQIQLRKTGVYDNMCTMNGLKNFFYKNNDIIIVLLILIVAAFLIYSRVNLIMDYPEKMAAQNLTETVQETETTGTADEIE